MIPLAPGGDPLAGSIPHTELEAGPADDGLTVHGEPRPLRIELVAGNLRSDPERDPSRVGRDARRRDSSRIHRQRQHEQIDLGVVRTQPIAEPDAEREPGKCELHPPLRLVSGLDLGESRRDLSHVRYAFPAAAESGAGPKHRDPHGRQQRNRNASPCPRFQSVGSAGRCEAMPDCLRERAGRDCSPRGHAIDVTMRRTWPRGHRRTPCGTPAWMKTPEHTERQAGDHRGEHEERVRRSRFIQG